LVSNSMIVFVKFEFFWPLLNSFGIWIYDFWNCITFCAIYLKLRSTLGKDYEIKSGVYWEQDWEHFAKHMGCKSMRGGNTGNIRRVGTFGREHLAKQMREHTLEFLRTMETTCGKASSRINFSKNTWRTNCERHWEHHAGTKVLNPTIFKVPCQ